MNDRKFLLPCLLFSALSFACGAAPESEPAPSPAPPGVQPRPEPTEVERLPQPVDETPPEPEPVPAPAPAPVAERAPVPEPKREPEPEPEPEFEREPKAEPQAPPPAPTPTPTPKAEPVAQCPGKPVQVAPTREGLTVIGASKCKTCHRVQYDSWAGSAHAACEPPLECESCHGPGSEYKGLAVMKDPVQARAAGLVDPSAEFCRSCHVADWRDEMLARAHAHKGE